MNIVDAFTVSAYAAAMPIKMVFLAGTYVFGISDFISPTSLSGTGIFDVNDDPPICVKSNLMIFKSR